MSGIQFLRSLKTHEAAAPVPRHSEHCREKRGDGGVKKVGDKNSDVCL